MVADQPKQRENKMNFTIAFALEEHARLYAEYNKKYKTPKEQYAHWDERTKIAEIVRGLYILEIWQREGSVGNPISTLRRYSLQSMESFADKYLSHLEIEATALDMGSRMPRRQEKYDAFDKWAKENRTQEYSTEQLVEISGFSYQTTLRHLTESPLYTKVKKGLWRVVADRNVKE
jgi:hypothetical protein